METYDRLKQQLQRALDDLAILAGDVVGPSGCSWQDVAGTASVNLKTYARMLDSLRMGEEKFNMRFPWVGVTVFPSVSECLDDRRDWEEVRGE